MKYTNNSSGNVLFLILIAVALFAALSYAVTQSTRSGGGDASQESNSVKAANLLQYTAAIRTAVQRMIMNGVAVTDLEFNAPVNFSNCTSPSVCVFHPSGGGALYPNSQPSGLGIFSGAWTFNMDYEVKNIGKTGVDGNDLVAFSLDIDKGVCEAINKKLGLPYSPVPVTGTQMYSPEEISLLYMDDNYTAPTSATSGIIGNSGVTFIALSGQYEGCYLGNDTDEEYVFFSVLSAR